MMTAHHIDQRLRWFIFLLLFAIYLLIYTGIPDSADGNALLALANAFYRQGDADVSVIGAEDALFQFDMARMGVFGQDGGFYSKKGITPSLALLPLVAVAHMIPWLSTTATAMLLNVIVTAATAALLYTFVREIGARPRVAFVVSLIYGIGTTAFVYAKTLYGEPLSALLLLGALLAAYGYRHTKNGRNLLLIGGLIGLTMGINLTYALMLPIIAGYALLNRPINKQTLRASLLTIIPFTAMLVGIGLYNWLRFGSPLTSGYYFSSGEGFNKPFLAGLFGLTFSPYRGIFWYSPILILAIWGWFSLRRQHPTLAWVLLLIFMTQLASYASWWSWHGGVTWGPRFLVPVIPIFTLALVPLVDKAFTWHWLRVLLIILFSLSLIVQLLGGLLSYFPYTGDLMRNYAAASGDTIVDMLSDQVLFNAAISPIVGHWRMLFAGAQLDPLWLTHGFQPAIPLMSILLLGAAVAVLRIQRRIVAVAVVALAVAFLTMGRCSWSTEQCQQVAEVETTLQPSATTLFATTAYGSRLHDIESGHIMSMNAPTTPDDPLASRMWANALRRSQDSLLWYVTWFAPADIQNWQERELWAASAYALQRETNGHRALLFRRNPPSPQPMPDAIPFGDIALVGRTVHVVSEGIFVSLQWQAQAALDGDYTWFVHLIDANGSIIAQQDRAPQGGYLPTSMWQNGQRITDYLYFPLPSAAIDQALNFRLGWVDPLTGNRLLESNDGFVILPIQ